ncbi:hypothetical protein ACOTET_26695 [Achromobacter xylosoxidans]
MSKSEALIKAIRSLPDGFYVHPISSFVNGTVRTTKQKTIVVPVEISIEQLGSPYEDLRAVLNPENNKLIPLLLFVDPDIAAPPKENNHGDTP